MAPQPGLSVTVSPSASAFFAGEVFTATITFRNTHPPVPEPSTSTTPHPSSPAQRSPYASPGHARTASSVQLGSWRTSANQAGPGRDAWPRQNQSPASPPSFGRTASSGHVSHPSLSAAASASTTDLVSPPTSPRRPVFSSTSSTGSLRPPPSTTNSPSSPSASSSAPSLPTRKGLIGKTPPPPPTLSLAVPPSRGGGLYANGPRRPELLGGGHARAQSMAVSSPDLLLRNGQGTANGEAGGRNFTAPSGPPDGGRLAGGHAKSRFGGSVVGGGLAGQPSEDDLRAIGQQDRAPLIAEESSPVDRQQPNFPDDAAFPVSESSSAPAPPHFPRRPTFGHQRTPSNLPYAMNSRARVSSLTLASDDSDSDYDADEANTSGNGFYGMGQNDTMESVLEAKYSRHAMQKAGPLTNRIASAPSAFLRPVQDRNRAISYGHEPEPSSPSLLHPPNTLAVLWAFAHLEGTFEVDESLIKPAEFLEVKRLLAGGTGGVGVGGGTLEDRRTGGGWREWLGWGRGGANQGGSAGPGAGAGMAAEDPRGAASLEERKDRAIKDRSVPTLSCPPCILAVDLVLQPGQSKSFTFSIRIPADLPPSFRGKAIKFNYYLVVGSNRISLGPISLKHATDDVRPVPKAQGKPSVSRVMRVPIRVYNHVGVTGARPFYDLTNPVIFQRDEAITADVQDKKETAVAVTKLQRPDTGKDDFESYAVNLLSSVASNSPEIVQNPSLSPTLEATRSPTLMEAPPSLRPEMSSHRGGGGKAIEAFGLDVDEAEGCKAAVEIVSRNSQKVSYDINKDGYQVASLTLVKSAYRLGETVNGSILLNGGEGRVLRVSARLETHELVETSISTMPAPRMRQITRRLHAEHHEMTLDAARLGFALAIPSGATPDFGTSGVKLQWSVRLSFLVIPPSPEASAGATPNITPRRLAAALGASGSGGRSSPNGGTSTPPRHGRSKSFAYGFEPAVPVTLPPPPPIPPSGAAHLMPVPPRAGEPTPVRHISYRAVPDLGYVPVLFSSAMPEPPPAPGPLQKAASGAHHRPTPSMSLARGQQSPFGNGSAVLVPAKVETVECSIPIKVYPGNTPFRPTITVFDA
ncbi:hypothetical protein NBRC10513_002275 [Rhodotorula toruloides]|uniref:Rgp1-domain containing protein n=1 Tax=Rhodotorula toruloides TaxID=5286 RepID=A0A2T0A8G0_RHOTO|nr:Rgp1-domain containing protein [Rhodotorula toruloides]